MTQTAELLDSHAEIARSRVEDLPETTSEGLRDVRDCCGEAVVSGNDVLPDVPTRSERVTDYRSRYPSTRLSTYFAITSTSRWTGSPTDFLERLVIS